MSWWKSVCWRDPATPWKMVADILLVAVLLQLQKLLLLPVADYWLTAGRSSVVAGKGRGWKTASTRHCGPPSGRLNNTG